MINLYIGDLYKCDLCEVQWANPDGIFPHPPCWNCGEPGQRIAVKATVTARSESEVDAEEGSV